MGVLAHNTFLNDAYYEAYVVKEPQKILILEYSSAHYNLPFCSLGYIPTNTDINLPENIFKESVSSFVVDGCST